MFESHSHRRLTNKTKLQIATAICCATGMVLFVVFTGLDEARLQRMGEHNPEYSDKQTGLMAWWAVGTAPGTFVTSCFFLWMPRLWRGTLRETNQMSKAIQGRLDEPTYRNRGDGI